MTLLGYIIICPLASMLRWSKSQFLLVLQSYSNTLQMQLHLFLWIFFQPPPQKKTTFNFQFYNKTQYPLSNPFVLYSWKMYAGMIFTTVTFALLAAEASGTDPLATWQLSQCYWLLLKLTYTYYINKIILTSLIIVIAIFLFVLGFFFFGVVSFLPFCRKY